MIISGSVSLLRATPCRVARRLALPNVPPGSGGCSMIDGKRGPLLPVLLPMLAGPGLRRRRFAPKDSFQYPLEGYSDPLWAEAHVESYALKDSDPLRAEARVESYAADTRPDAPPGASNCGF